jgi:multiple sugar transport system permease protein
MATATRTRTRPRSKIAGRSGRSYVILRTITTILRYVLMLFVAAIMIIPFLWMLGTSFKPIDETVRWPPDFTPDNPTLEPYRHVIKTIPIVRYFLNSVVSSGAITVLAILTSSLAGYIFEKFRFPGRDAIFFIIIASMMIPFQVRLIPVYLIVRWLKLTNTLWALIVPGIVSAWGIFMMRQAMKTVPDELLDAARIDGASEMGIFVRIVLPISQTAIAAAGVFIFMFYWNAYVWPLIVLDDKMVQTLPLGLATFAGGFGIIKWNYTMAGVVLSVVPIFIVFAFAQRRLIEGITMGSLKG